MRAKLLIDLHSDADCPDWKFVSSDYGKPGQLIDVQKGEDGEYQAAIPTSPGGVSYVSLGEDEFEIIDENYLFFQALLNGNFRVRGQKN